MPARTCFPLLVLLTISSSPGGNPPQKDHSEVALDRRVEMGRHLKSKGIPNFGEVTPALYRGGQPSIDGFEALAHMGIAIVVDTGRSKRDEALVKNLGMNLSTVVLKS